VTLIDECDELTQGKGNKSLNVPHREDPGTYQQYISEDARGEDEEDDDIPPFDPDGRRASRGSRKENVGLVCLYILQEHKLVKPGNSIVTFASLTYLIIS
jgi:hypothetical protein